MNQSVAMIFSRTFLLFHVEYLSVPNFLAAAGNLGGKMPIVDYLLASDEQEKYPLPHSIKTAQRLNFNWI